MREKFILAPYVIRYGKKAVPVLDINANRDAAQAAHLRAKGFVVTAYSESFSRTGVHDRSALGHTYETVYADGWLSAQTSLSRIRGCIIALAGVTKAGGVAIADYSGVTRQSRTTSTRIVILLKEKFKTVQQVGGSAVSPVWLLRR